MSRLVTNLPWLALAVVPLLAACAGEKPRDPVATALTSEEPPADFSLGLTVVAPPPGADTARSAVPARYVVQCDWVLRASTSEISEKSFPPLTRQLTHDQARQLWWEVRDSGLSGSRLESDFVTEPAVPAAGSGPTYIVSTKIAGRTSRLVLDGSSTTASEAAVAKRLADRLAGLAWMER